MGNLARSFRAQVCQMPIGGAAGTGPRRLCADAPKTGTLPTPVCCKRGAAHRQRGTRTTGIRSCRACY